MFPGTLIMYGSHEKYILERASDWVGLATRRTEACESHSGSRGQSSVFGPPIMFPTSLKTAPGGVSGGRFTW
jgi:type IV secretion system protein VirD4